MKVIVENPEHVIHVNSLTLKNTIIAYKEGQAELLLVVCRKTLKTDSNKLFEDTFRFVPLDNTLDSEYQYHEYETIEEAVKDLINEEFEVQAFTKYREALRWLLG